MGSSLDVTLIYGYDLGGDPDSGWFFNKVNDQYQPDWPAWVKLDEEGYPDDEYDGFIEQASKRLTEVMAGFTEEYDCSSSWYERKRAAEEAAGVNLLTFDMRGVDNGYEQWTFGVPLGSGNDLMVVDPDWFQPAHLHRYESILERALAVLKIEFEDQPGPRLLATSSYF